MSVVQIAAQAGVSIATVSRVLNNSRRVNPKLVDQVHRAMVDLNFNPSHIRRKSQARRSQTQPGTIAIVSVGQSYREWFALPVLAAVLAEITREAQENSLTTLVTEMRDPNQLSPSLRRDSVDGVLAFFGSDLTAEQSLPLAKHMPTVRVMGGQMSQLFADHVGPDNSAVGDLASQYLRSMGCRNLFLFISEPTWDMNRLRALGFAASSLAAGIHSRTYVRGAAETNDNVYGANTFMTDSTSDLLSRLAQDIKGTSVDGPVGLFVSRDVELGAVYRALSAQGIRIGHEVIIVSCDNMQIHLNSLHPRPVSIDLNPVQVAKHAVARLLERIRNPDEAPVRILINPILSTTVERNGVPHFLQGLPAL